MNSKHFSVLFLFLCFTVFGQQKISVEKIYTGAFRAQGMDELHSLKNTNQYTVLNEDMNGEQQIDLFDFATLKKTSTLFDTKNYSKDLPNISSYTFDTTEKINFTSF